MKPIIILISHGMMANETLKSAKMIVGDIKNIFAIGMLHNDGLEGTSAKLDDILTEYKKETEFVILADLKGGTPANISLMKMNEYPNLKVVTGLNLAMVIEATISSLNRADELSKYLEKIGRLAVDQLTPHFIDNDNEEYEE